MLNVSGKNEFCLQWGPTCFLTLVKRDTLLYGEWFCIRDSPLKATCPQSGSNCWVKVISEIDKSVTW